MALGERGKERLVKRWGLLHQTRAHVQVAIRPGEGRKQTEPKMQLGDELAW